MITVVGLVAAVAGAVILTAGIIWAAIDAEATTAPSQWVAGVLMVLGFLTLAIAFAVEVIP